VASGRRALSESLVWIGCGLAFGIGVWATLGVGLAGEYYSAYLLEKSMSVDNVFVWSVIFTTFSIPLRFQHRVLFWGVFGALVLRAGFIITGLTLLRRFSWLDIVFGAIVLATAVRIARGSPPEVHPDRNLALRAFRRVVPSTDGMRGHRLVVRERGRWLTTPLFAVLVMVETTDVVFAVDSIPAVLAVSSSEFVAYASNAFAVLGLRALYFVVAHLKERFAHLERGVAIVLAFVGVKMLTAHWVHVPTGVSLGVIALILSASILLSPRGATS